MTAVTGVVPGSDVIDRFLGYLRAGGTPRTTLATRRSHMHRVARCLGHPLAIDAVTLVEWCAAQTWAIETRRGYRGTLLAFYRWAVRFELIAFNPADSLPRIRPANPTPRPAPDAVYRTALRDAQPRVRLMLRLAAEAGMRRAEVARVHADDILIDLDGRSLHVVGKGGKLRILPLTDSLAVELVDAAKGGGYLFPGRDNGHLSPRWVGKLVTRALPDGITMHPLRHRFATRVYDSTRDMFTVQDLLGHASPDTTRRYVRVPADAARAAMSAAA